MDAGYIIHVYDRCRSGQTVYVAHTFHELKRINAFLPGGESLKSQRRVETCKAINIDDSYQRELSILIYLQMWVSVGSVSFILESNLCGADIASLWKSEIIDVVRYRFLVEYF